MRLIVRFKLRTLLAAIAVFAIPLGYFVNGAHKQRWAIDQIQSCGNQSAAFYDYDDFAGRELGLLSRLPTWCQSMIGPEYFSKPVYARVYEPPDDRWAPAVNSLTSIQTLELMGENISDGSLAKLGNLTRLADLTLFQTAVSEEGLVVIHIFPRLRKLSIAETNIADLRHLRLENCRELKELDLCEVALTDDAVPYLSKLKQLQRLHLRNSGISDRGVESIRKALPDCDVW